MTTNTPGMKFVDLLMYNKPQAISFIKGNKQNPQLHGVVKFYQTHTGGVLIEAEVFGLPNISKENSSDFHALHIHENGDCSMNFEKAGSHYNPTNKPHPYHLGDLLPLMGNQGYAWLSFYDNRFKISDIIGKSIIIHQMRDDFTTKPSGASGKMIGCGVIH